MVKVGWWLAGDEVVGREVELFLEEGFNVEESLGEVGHLLLADKRR